MKFDHILCLEVNKDLRKSSVYIFISKFNASKLPSVVFPVLAVDSNIRLNLPQMRNAVRI